MLAEMCWNGKAGLLLAAVVAARTPGWGGSMPPAAPGPQGKPAIISKGQVGPEIRKIQQDGRFNTGAIVNSGDHTGSSSAAGAVAAVRASEGNTLKADPTFQMQVNRIMEQIEAILVDPRLQEAAKRVPERATDAYLQDQAKRIVEQMEFMMSSPNFQQRAERVAKRIDVLIADRNFQNRVQLVGAQLKMLSSCPACPQFQEHAKHIVEQVLMMMAHPNLQERATRVAEQMDILGAGQGIRDTLVDSLADGLFDRARNTPIVPLR